MSPARRRRGSYSHERRPIPVPDTNILATSGDSPLSIFRDFSKPFLVRLLRHGPKCLYESLLCGGFRRPAAHAIVRLRRPACSGHLAVRRLAKERPPEAAEL